MSKMVNMVNDFFSKSSKVCVVRIIRFFHQVVVQIFIKELQLVC